MSWLDILGDLPELEPLLPDIEKAAATAQRVQNDPAVKQAIATAQRLMADQDIKQALATIVKVATILEQAKA
jgi:hypothetical protein